MSEVMIGARYRVRVSLIDSEPEIWRLIELDADLNLEDVHHVIQRAFGWRTEHLHMFAKDDPRARQLGGGQRWYDQESLDEGLPGMLETDFTLGQVIDKGSPVAFYEYDFGDGWLHRIELIEVTSAGTASPATLIDGERRGPLEDSGGIHGYLDKLDTLANPQHPEHEHIRDWVEDTLGPWESFDPDDIDVEHVNAELELLGDRAPVGRVPLWMDLSSRMLGSRGSEFRRYVSRIGLDEPASVNVATAARMVEPYAWLLRRIGTDGLTLTGAGWLPPAVVSDAMNDLDWGWRWIGTFNREDNTLPVARLRANAQRFGLIRKLKGRLLLTSAGTKLLDDPVGLWHGLAEGFVRRQSGEAARDVAALYAVEIARDAVDGSRRHLEPVAYGLGMLGWANSDGGWVSADDTRYLLSDAGHLCEDLGVFERGVRRHEVAGVTLEGRAFARAVLQS